MHVEVSATDLKPPPDDAELQSLQQYGAAVHIRSLIPTKAAGNYQAGVAILLLRKRAVELHAVVVRPVRDADSSSRQMHVQARLSAESMRTGVRTV